MGVYGSHYNFDYETDYFIFHVMYDVMALLRKFETFPVFDKETEQREKVEKYNYKIIQVICQQLEVLIKLF
jgi:hypothetical protein